MLMGSAALPLRAPARGAILSTCRAKPWRGCPEDGGDLGEKLTGFSEAMVMYGSKSDKSASTFAPASARLINRNATLSFVVHVHFVAVRVRRLMAAPMGM